MRPNKIGQLVKFHTPLADENPKQLYVVFEIVEDVEIPRVAIKALNNALSFLPINKVKLDDLEIVDVGTNDLIGHTVTIRKSDYSDATGKVTKVSVQKINLDLSRGVKAVETNVWVTIEDEIGKEQMGNLILNM
jgi:hypothetical protein